MPTVNPGTPYTNTLRAGATLTVAVPAGGLALVERTDAVGTIQKTSVAAGTSTTIGPFLAAAAVRVSSFFGPVEVSAGVVDAGVGSNYSDAQAVAAARAGIPASLLSAVQAVALQRIYSGANATGRIRRTKSNVAAHARAYSDNVDSTGSSAQVAPTMMLANEIVMPIQWTRSGSSARVLFKNASPNTTGLGLTGYRVYCTLEFQNKYPGGTGTVVIPLTFGGQPSGVMPATPGAELLADNPGYLYTAGEMAYIKAYYEHPTDPGNSQIAITGGNQGGESASNPPLVGTLSTGFSWAAVNPTTGPTRIQTKYKVSPYTSAAFAKGHIPVGVFSDEANTSPVISADVFGDSLQSQKNRNFLEVLGLQSSVQINNYCAPGSNSGTFPDKYMGRIQVACGNIGILCHGHNGMSQGNIQAMWKWMRSKYEKVVHLGTSWDVYSSNGNWNDKSTMALTGVSVTYANVKAWNDWCRAQVGTADGPDEYYDFVQCTRDPADNLCYVDGTGLAANKEIDESSSGNLGVHLSPIGVTNAVARAVALGWDKSIFS